MEFIEISVQNQPLKLYIENKNAKKEYAYIFLNGLNARPNLIEYLTQKINDQALMVTFDNLDYENNNFKHTKNYHKYLKFNFDVINEIKKISFLKNKKIIILGESFGASIGLLLSQMYPKLANLFFLWNAPTKITQNKQMPHKFKTSMKTLITYLFNIETYCLGYFDERITSNKAIIRINRLEKNRKVSTMLNLVCWKTMHLVKQYLKKGLNDNVYLVQSHKDIMCDWSFFNELNNKNLILYNNGYHLLSFEKESTNLFNDLLKIIKTRLC